MKREIITCDNCGREKGPNNHWLLIEIFVAQFVAIPWDEKRLNLKMACGENCASAMFAQWMEKLLPKKVLANPQ